MFQSPSLRLRILFVPKPLKGTYCCLKRSLISWISTIMECSSLWIWGEHSRKLENIIWKNILFIRSCLITIKIRVVLLNSGSLLKWWRWNHVKKTQNLISWKCLLKSIKIIRVAYKYYIIKGHITIDDLRELMDECKEELTDE